MWIELNLAGAAVCVKYGWMWIELNLTGAVSELGVNMSDES
jgi:hypothetical protein